MAHKKTDTSDHPDEASGTIRSMRVSFSIFAQLAPKIAEAWREQFGECDFVVVVAADDWDYERRYHAKLGAAVREIFDVAKSEGGS